jgi:hypothetical protein
MNKEKIIPDEFLKVVKDFVFDLRNTFPEYDLIISKWWKKDSEYDYIEEEEARSLAIAKGNAISAKIVFEFCKKKMPPRFFDILYQNEDMFKEDSDVDTEFLPHVYFKTLWQFDISQKTRDIIWKYLQLIMFAIVGTLDNKDVFGDTAKMFEAINQDEFKDKLQETISKMQDLFDTSTRDTNDTPNESPGLGANLNSEDIPKVDDIHDHISGMLNGKLGSLAKEIAEETAKDINLDINAGADVKDVLSSLIKDPAKLMNLVKNVGSKLDAKMKSGEIKESELISEATDLMNKMKNMQGMNEIQAMLSKMGMNGKLNTGAMEAQLNRSMKLAQQKERMRSKVESNRATKEQEASGTLSPQQSPQISEEDILKIFGNDENHDKSQKSKKKKTKK